MRYPDQRIKSVADFLRILKLRRNTRQPVWYRGQEKSRWDLSPTISRCGGITAEAPLITRFKQNALSLLPERPSNEWEWLFVMRHYGVPTRLMDWTENPLVALYFAASQAPKSEGVVWNLLPIDLNKLANIAPQHPSEIPGFGDYPILDNYLPSRLASESTSNLLPAAAIAPRNTRRMQAQQGVFTITHRGQTDIGKIGNLDHIWKILIPASSKQRIVSELNAFNVNRLSLFPELDHVAAYAREALG